MEVTFVSCLLRLVAEFSLSSFTKHLPLSDSDMLPNDTVPGSKLLMLSFSILGKISVSLAFCCSAGFSCLTFEVSALIFASSFFLKKHEPKQIAKKNTKTIAATVETPITT